MTFQRADDPDRPGQLVLADGEPVGSVFWAHDYAEREQTGWFLVPLGHGAGRPRRLRVSDDVDRLVTDTELGRADWLARAETVELVTATAALEAGERALERLLGERDD
jgi:hypothetical protein